MELCRASTTFVGALCCNQVARVAQLVAIVSGSGGLFIGKKERQWVDGSSGGGFARARERETMFDWVLSFIEDKGRRGREIHI